MPMLARHPAAVKPRDSLRGRVALVTGAAGGIGRATARAFAREGARLVLVDRDRDALREAEAELAGDVVAFAADVTSAEAVEEYVGETVARLGALDVLFNNAGIEGEIAPIVEADAAAFDAVVAVNVTGVWLNLKYALRAMRTLGRGGSVVNTSSGLGLYGVRGMSAYVASKHAVVGLTKAAALEGAGHGVRVNAICPGLVDTRMMAALEQLGQVERPAYEAIVPMGRYGSADEVAELVVFLASERSAWLSGAAISVDGGTAAD
jgi:NAD(P)-dependent dehydrogenase (short-subunit alcohol dehydrogenase family)